MKTYTFKGWKINRSGILSRTPYKPRDIKDSATSVLYYGKQMSLYRAVWCIAHQREDVPKGYEIHHIDCNPRNCRPSNLVALPKKEHKQAHVIFRSCGKLAYNHPELIRPFKEYDSFIDYWRSLEVNLWRKKVPEKVPFLMR